MKLSFSKMHGLGNDFVVIDATQSAINLTAKQAQAIADRRRGIGCDQILIVQATSDTQTDFRYRIINADGSEVEQCGNGARCLAKFIHDKGLSSKNPLIVETQSRFLSLELNDDQVTVDMGVPDFKPESIPLAVKQQQTVYDVRLNGETLNFMAVSMGNPHAVLPVDNVYAADVTGIGAQLEQHALFPEKANIGFMQKIDQHRIRLRVFERGVGETQACGSGACAAAVTGIAAGELATPVAVELPGGILTIHWAGVDQPVFMRGSANHVFDGSINLPTTE